MKRLKHMQDVLIDCAECQLAHIEEVDTKELGEVMDMIKDISETIYYYTVTEAMHSKSTTYDDGREVHRSAEGHSGQSHHKAKHVEEIDE